jgi:hypothetical protein
MKKTYQIITITCVIFVALSFNLYATDDFIYTCRTDQAQISVANGSALLLGGELNSAPGAPKVGYRIVRVILPTNTKLDSIETITGEPLVLSNNISLDFSGGDTKADRQPNLQVIQADPVIYSSDSLYPMSRAKVLYSGYWGNIAVADLAIYPLAYRPQSGKLELFEDIQVRIKLSEIAPELSVRMKGDPIAYSALMESAVNKNDLLPYASTNIGGTPLSCGLPEAEHLVITSSAIADGFQAYVDWKNQKGLHSRIVFVEDILASSSGIDPQEKIRNFLIGAHYAGTRWVLLGGDEDIIPIRYLFAGNADSTAPPLAIQQIGDMYYADLTGNWDADSDGVWGETVHDQRDIYPEIYVGRVPVRSASEAAIWSAKAVTYEKNPGGGDPSYLNKALVICADEMRDLGQHNTVSGWISNNFTVDAQRLIEQPSGSSASPTQPTGQQVIDVMQEGWGFISNQNHGDFSYYASRTSGFNVGDRSDVWGDTVLFEFDGGYSRLANNGKPGIHYSTSCDVGAIDFDKGVFYPGPYYTTYSLAESYLSQPGGGAAFLGYGRWGWLIGSLTLENKFIRRILVDSTCNLGVAEALSKIDYPTYSDIIYPHNLYGDPEMPFWISVEGALSIVGPEQVMEKQNQVVLFQVFDGENPAEGAKVCLYKRDEIFLIGNTNDQGEASFEIEPDSAGIMTVTATLPRHIPAQNIIGIQSISGVNGESSLPTKPEMAQNYPNPFNSSTTLSFSLSHTGQVNISIFDIGGRLVRILTTEVFTTGQNRIIWNGRNDNGYEVSTGLYFCRFESEGFSDIKQLTLIR